MPVIYPEDPADEFDWLAAGDWRESAEDRASTVSMSGSQQEATLTGFIPFNKERSAFRVLCGYSYADTESPWELHRIPPVRHPRYNSLVCYSASATPISVVSNPANDNGEPNKTSPFDTSRYTSYAESIFTLQFRSFGRVKFLPDDQIEAGEESKRYTTLGIAPAVQTITRQGGYALQFAEAPASTAGTNPPNSPITFNADLPELVPQANMTLKWYGVPHEYVSDNADVLHPAKILGLLGCVNSVAFYQSRFPIGTVLLTGVTFADTLFPVSTIDPDNDPATGYDIEFQLLYNPRTSDATGGASTKRGHQLFPWWAEGGPSGGPKWLNATRKDNSAYLPERDLNAIFDHVDKP